MLHWLQVSTAARDPSRSYIASPAASWLDDFLSWISPSLPHCCRQDSAGQQCPPPDQFPCNMSATACADCTPCFRTGAQPAPGVLVNRPTLAQVGQTAPLLNCIDSWGYGLHTELLHCSGQRLSLHYCCTQVCSSDIGLTALHYLSQRLL